VNTSAEPCRETHGGPPPRWRVLFLCLGNACRSQMAEGFARVYGSDVLAPSSAGLAPAMGIPPDTLKAMDEKNVDLRQQFPKGWWQLALQEFDMAVNMSGFELPPQIELPVRTWKVPDPVLMSYKRHCQIRDQVEGLVMELVLELRRARKKLRA
jgi:arsenate reductase (thioredoxin)